MLLQDLPEDIGRRREPFHGLEATAFTYTKGSPRSFTLTDGSPTREFCGDCGVHIAARSPKAAGGIVVKVGTLDDPSVFDEPNLAFWVSEKENYHLIPEDVSAYAALPGR